MTIARFLARRYNLAGKNDLEEAEADMLVDSMTDTFEGKWRFGLFCRSCPNFNYYISRFIKGQLLIHVRFILGFVGCLKEGKIIRNNPERQKMLIEEFKTKTLPAFLDLFQKLLDANGGKYLVGSDVCFYNN